MNKRVEDMQEIEKIDFKLRHQRVLKNRFGNVIPEITIVEDYFKTQGTIFHYSTFQSPDVGYKAFMVDLNNQENTRVAMNLADMFNINEWRAIDAYYEKRIAGIKAKKDAVKKRIGYGTIFVNQFTDFEEYREHGYSDYLGTKAFTGTVKGNWLTDGNGKRHKINGNQVVDFKFYESEEAFNESNQK